MSGIGERFKRLAETSEGGIGADNDFEFLRPIGRVERQLVRRDFLTGDGSETRAGNCGAQESLSISRERESNDFIRAWRFGEADEVTVALRGGAGDDDGRTIGFTN